MSESKQEASTPKPSRKDLVVDCECGQTFGRGVSEDYEILCECGRTVKVAKRLDPRTR